MRYLASSIDEENIINIRITLDYVVESLHNDIKLGELTDSEISLIFKLRDNGFSLKNIKSGKFTEVSEEELRAVHRAMIVLCSVVWAENLNKWFIPQKLFREIGT